MSRDLRDSESSVAPGRWTRRRAGEIIGPGGLRLRRYLKRFMYSQLSMRAAIMIILGREQPLVPFTVEADPPSVYLVFAIRRDALESLAERLDMPAELEPAAIRCIAGEDPEYYLTLNIYRVSGITNALRAEWSVYVAEREAPDTPRYLVVDARSSTPSMDPVDIITPKSRVEHQSDGAEIISTVGDEPESFRSTIRLPRDGSHDEVVTAAEWAGANDRIYWANGVRDRTYYDARMAAPRLARITPADVTVDDRSPWADLVESAPRHVLVHRDAIEFVVSPWENIDEIQA